MTPEEHQEEWTVSPLDWDEATGQDETRSTLFVQDGERWVEIGTVLDVSWHRAKQAFASQYLQEPSPEDQAKDREAYRLAEEYATSTEAFDQQICSGRRNGIAIPATSDEGRWIEKNAWEVREQIMRQALPLGISWKDIRRQLDAVQDRMEFLLSVSPGHQEWEWKTERDRFLLQRKLTNAWKRQRWNEIHCSECGFPVRSGEHAPDCSKFDRWGPSPLRGMLRVHLAALGFRDAVGAALAVLARAATPLIKEVGQIMQQLPRFHPLARPELHSPARNRKGRREVLYGKALEFYPSDWYRAAHRYRKIQRYWNEFPKQSIPCRICIRSASIYKKG